MARLTRVRTVDGVAVVTIDAPPVNALSADVRAGLWDIFGWAHEARDIRAVVLGASGAMFSAGADFREFGTAPKRPSLPELCNRIEACAKPVVAALQGQVLGGGAELALAAHGRVADPRARIGLPELSLGLIPGAGGTQRLPRLVGPDAALHMLISTTPVDASVALRLGLVDGLADEDVGEAAMAHARRLADQGRPPRQTRALRNHFKDGRAYTDAVAKARAALAGNPLHAPHRVVDCVEAAALLPFDAGLAFEEDAFARCLTHAQSVALRHVFMAERRADTALIVRSGARFKPVEPMGKSVVARLRKAWHGAAQTLLAEGLTEPQIDGSMVAFGFRKGPFDTRDGGDRSEGIVRRMVSALLVEGAACVDQGAVQRPSDVDALAVHGLGFPRREGGPFRAAQTMGLLRLRADMRNWAEASDLWQVPPLLDSAIKDARGFDQFNEV